MGFPLPDVVVLILKRVFRSVEVLKDAMGLVIVYFFQFHSLFTFVFIIIIFLLSLLLLLLLFYYFILLFMRCVLSLTLILY